MGQGELAGARMRRFLAINKWYKGEECETQEDF